MRTGLGSNFIPNAGSSFKESAAQTSARLHDTPANIKFTCATKDARYFGVAQDPTFWGSSAYGVVAISQIDFNILTKGQPSSAFVTTIREARERADRMNSQPSNDPVYHRGAAANVNPPQSFKR